MGAEFNREFGADLAITLIPGGSGILEVSIDGHTIFDRDTMGRYPNYEDVTQMKIDAKEIVPALIN
ncbi:MAG: hypothetical protein CL793_04390 [Chloroflexi bacterium]|nr:hypothetical protein [Chloroflexota bacterium]